MQTELAEPSKLLAGGGYEHLGLEAHAMATIAGHMHGQPAANFELLLGSHGGAPLAVAGEVGQDVPYFIAAGDDVASGIFVLTVAENQISSMTRFGDKSLFACFGLPRTLLDSHKP
jgi:hypothetical protein